MTIFSIRGNGSKIPLKTPFSSTVTALNFAFSVVAAVPEKLLASFSKNTCL
jgi:hypothetical protein